MTDETGSPIAGANVEVDYSRGGGFASPPSFCPQNVFVSFCWIVTVTGIDGSHDFVFEPGPGSLWDSNSNALIYASSDGYEVNIQVVPTGTPDIVQNLRLRRVRPVNAGQSITISIEPDSSLCSDLEDWWLLTRRCENIEVLASETGMLTVEARAADGGGIIPLVFFATTGRYTSMQNSGPGTASVGVHAGERYRVYVGSPSGTTAAATERYDVTTSIR